MSPAEFLRILIVDDERPVRSALKRLFRPDGHTLFFAASAEQAISLLSTITVDLVLTDQAMPGRSGLELLEWVSKASPDTSRMILSGHLDHGSIAGIEDRKLVHRIIKKPWDGRTLRETVRQVKRITQAKG